MNPKRKMAERPEGEPEEKRGKRRAYDDPARIHICTTCQKGFVTPAQLRVHGLIHSPPKYSCPNCFFTCRRITELKRHSPKCKQFDGKPHGEYAGFDKQQNEEDAGIDKQQDEEGTGIDKQQDEEGAGIDEQQDKEDTEIDEPLTDKSDIEIEEYVPSEKKLSAKNGIRAPPDDPRRQHNICPTCAKGYVTQNQLWKHQKVHEEKEYKCSFCDYAGRFPEMLRYHMVKHSGNKPYYCSECERGFRRPCEMSRHNKKYHYSASKEPVASSVSKEYMCTKCNTQIDDKVHFENHILDCGKE
jgi:hypothetical protein